MLSLFKKKPLEPPFLPFDFDNNPFKAKKQWPPDFDMLTQKDKFKLERRFRRRAKLAYARPEWNRRLLLVQWGACIFVVGYAALYMEWEGDGAPQRSLRKVRTWYHGLADSIWTHSASDISRKHLQEAQGKAGNASPS
jgi:hypothetical protein